MSADYDRLFHSPDALRTVGEDQDRDTPPAGHEASTSQASPNSHGGPAQGEAPPSIPLNPMSVQTATAPPPHPTEVTTQIPTTPGPAPQALPDNGLMRVPQTHHNSGARHQRAHQAPAPAPRPAPPPAPSQHFADNTPDRRQVPQQAATSAAAIGNHRAIDALSHVGVRSAVKLPPQRGWRHWLYVLTRINLGLSPDELYEMDLHARIRRNARDSYQIGVFGLKGGVGKTAVTVALGSALSTIRGDRILAIDADPDGGNLADRAGRQSAATIADLLSDKELHRYNDIRAYTSMNGANLEVLSSEEYSAARREFNDHDWKSATDIVSRYYNLVLADCGAGLFQPGARGVLSTVSGLVIVASASIDGARQAAITMDWLRQNGYQDLLGRSCVVINHVVPGKPNIDVEDLVQQFERHVTPGRVIVLPYDKHIASGTEIQIGLLGSTFSRRIVELAAALSDDFDRLERR
ncbi:ESX-1 associated ATP-binding protein EpsI N-terminal domain-containing protein [Mycolicibacterium vaccae]|uniref:MinD/ParA family ATP-binding protein n=1 Tax=Mycolicibacterium vaccae TaxID=1810 RepID=UPI003D02B219